MNKDGHAWLNWQSSKILVLFFFFFPNSFVNDVLFLVSFVSFMHNRRNVPRQIKEKV